MIVPAVKALWPRLHCLQIKIWPKISLNQVAPGIPGKLGHGPRDLLRRKRGHLPQDFPANLDMDLKIFPDENVAICPRISRQTWPWTSRSSPTKAWPLVTRSPAKTWPLAPGCPGNHDRESLFENVAINLSVNPKMCLLTSSSPPA